jgi:hypothetical protein
MHTVETIPYTVQDYSSYAYDYHPNNILHSNRSDLRARWLSNKSDCDQFILLRLDEPAIVHTITFGKYMKSHATNIKEFKVFGGPSPRAMTQLLYDTLQNNSLKETFRLVREIRGLEYPCRYIKIVPYSSWEPGLNFSIWYVELSGVVDKAYVESCTAAFEQRREQEAIRICLKHLRNSGHTQVFKQLQLDSGVRLEGDLSAKLFDCVVCVYVHH